jgi:hypothetical protein
MSQTAETAQEHARDAMEQLMRVSLITQQTLKFHRQTGTPKATRLSEILESVLTLFSSKLNGGRHCRGCAGRAGGERGLHAERDTADLREPGGERD